MEREFRTGMPRQGWMSEAYGPAPPASPQEQAKRQPLKSAMHISIDVLERLKPHLGPGEEPAIAIRTAADKRGDIGECWSVITPQHWYILNRPLGRSAIVSSYPLSQIARAEIKRDPYGRAECTIWGPHTIMDKILFSSLDLKAYEGINETLQTLKGVIVRPAPPAEAPGRRVERMETEEPPPPAEPREPKRALTLRDLFSERSLEDLFGQAEEEKKETPSLPKPKSPADKARLRNIVLTIFYLLLIALLSYFLNRAR
jgi:hypothetical protein